MKKSIQKPNSSLFNKYLNNCKALSVIFFALTSCAPKSSTSVEQASQKIADVVGCGNVKSKVFDAFYEMIDQGQIVPSADSFKNSVDNKLNQLLTQQKISDPKKLTQLKNSFHEVIDLFLQEAAQNPTITWKEQIQKLIEYELEDQSNLKVMQATNSINQKFADIKALSQSLDLPCATTSPDTAPTGPNAPDEANAGLTKALKISQGINMVFSTAYQSCRVLDLPEMDHATPDVLGISRVGTHADGIGGKRVIANLASVQNTHYYIRGIASESQCAPVRNSPLIYDYGGEPLISGNTINFQKNAGSGTDVLGVDCSAYISSAIAVAGLRYKPGVDNKPIFIRQTSSKFIDAAQSGFSCFDNVTVTPKNSIQAGDIVGVNGHVVAVDKVGADPFGLKLLKSAADCNSLNYKNFEIVVTQSSPSKNGIGINKYLAKDYLDESSKMKTAFTEMGKQACLSYFQNKNIKPKSAEWGFVRHKGTPECLAPRVTMAGESCTQKCF